MRGLALVLAAATLAGAPERIASLSPAATRIVRDLGAEAELVAVTRWCELAPGHRARRDADAFEPDLESLAAARPSLVLVPRLSNPLLAERLRGLGLRTMVLAPESPASPAEDIAAIGAALGREDASARLLAGRRAMEGGAVGGRRILVVWDGVMAAEGSYLAWAIGAAGGRALPGASRWPEWDRETAARYNPELVLYLDANGPESPRPDTARLEAWKSQPALRATDAASKGCIFHLRPSSDWLPASGLPRAAAILRQLGEPSGVR